jgi:hypothetical protein
MPPTVPINHYCNSITNKMNHSPIPLFHACVFMAIACLEHSYFFKVKCLILLPTNEDRTGFPSGWLPCTRPKPAYTIARSSTTSFLTATTLIYAIGAGITAAAGTRLALQLFLVKCFKLFSLQSRKTWSPRVVISCHYLPESGLGNLRACCLP